MAGKKVVTLKINTIQINKPGQYKPSSPIWMFKNTGEAVLLINSNYELHPGDSFGLDVSNMVATFLKEGIPVKSDTSFSVEFFDAAAATLFGQSLGLGHLIEAKVDVIETENS